MMSFMHNNAYKMISDLLKLFTKPVVISVIKRGIDLISVDIHKTLWYSYDIHIHNTQLKEVVIRYTAQIKWNKMKGKDEVTLEEISAFRKQWLI